MLPVPEVAYFCEPLLIPSEVKFTSDKSCWPAAGASLRVIGVLLVSFPAICVHSAKSSCQ